MYHDLDAGLIHLGDDELVLLAEVRSPVDERVVNYLIEGTEITISHLEDAIRHQEAINQAGIATSVPHEEVIANLEDAIEKQKNIRPMLEQIALDVEFKWRDSRLEQSARDSE